MKFWWKFSKTISGDVEFKCQDVDECQQASTKCHHFADCINNDGSYQCECKDGYKGDGYVECKIVDACGEMDRCGPNGKCTNVIGPGHVCVCDLGYRDRNNGLGPCENINECTESNVFLEDFCLE